MLRAQLDALDAELHNGGVRTARQADPAR